MLPLWRHLTAPSSYHLEEANRSAPNSPPALLPTTVPPTTPTYPHLTLHSPTRCPQRQVRGQRQGDQRPQRHQDADHHARPEVLAGHGQLGRAGHAGAAVRGVTGAAAHAVVGARSSQLRCLREMQGTQGLRSGVSQMRSLALAAVSSGACGGCRARRGCGQGCCRCGCSCGCRRSQQSAQVLAGGAVRGAANVRCLPRLPSIVHGRPKENKELKHIKFHRHPLACNKAAAVPELAWTPRVLPPSCCAEVAGARAHTFSPAARKQPLLCPTHLRSCARPHQVLNRPAHAPIPCAPLTCAPVLLERLHQVLNRLAHAPIPCAPLTCAPVLLERPHQVLNRLTYASTLSHLRRVNSPIGREGKLAKPRQLHNRCVRRACTWHSV